MGSEDYFERGCWLLQTKFNVYRMVRGSGSLVLCLKESLSKCSDDPDLLVTHPSTRDSRVLDHYQILPESKGREDANAFSSVLNWDGPEGCSVSAQLCWCWLSDPPHTSGTHTLSLVFPSSALCFY